ncbi:hypothetical protein [Streptomyces sp. NPDC026092]|uniref:hypothetical protein n=1 Tax=Streptomyces sp. NPDC026092 TaxID=3154797 RepID=UPI0033FA9BCC
MRLGFLDAATRHDSAAADPGAALDPKQQVAWLIRLAPGDLPRRFLARMAVWPLRRTASGNHKVELARQLIDTGDLAVWTSMFGGDCSLKRRARDGDAEIPRTRPRRTGALRASFANGENEEVRLTPYKQLAAAIRLWESGQVDELRALLAERGDHIRDADVREAFALALDRGSSQPLEAAAAIRREQDDLLDEALSLWGLRLQPGLKPHQLSVFSHVELVSVGRAVTNDPSYRVDWGIVRSRLVDPEMRHHRAQARERYGVLLAHADCPPDVVAALTDPELNRLDMLRLYADRDTAIATLTHGDLGPSGYALSAVWEPVCETTPLPGWTPAVTPEDVLRYDRPVQSALVFAPGEAVAQVIEEHGAPAATEDPAAEAALWMTLWRLTGYFSGPLPALLRTAVRLSGGGAPLDVVPAADFLVGPGRDTAADLVRERLGEAPGPWLSAVRLLATGFAGTLPELLDAASAEQPVEPGRATFLHVGPAALLGLAPDEVVDPVGAGLDVPTRVVLAAGPVARSAGDTVPSRPAAHVPLCLRAFTSFVPCVGFRGVSRPRAGGWCRHRSLTPHQVVPRSQQALTGRAFGWVCACPMGSTTARSQPFDGRGSRLSAFPGAAGRPRSSRPGGAGRGPRRRPHWRSVPAAG